jgi:sporulation protein YlmC with PRC-barrel domain
LRCTKAEFDQLEHAEEIHFDTATGDEWGYQGDVHVFPYQGLDSSRFGVVEDFGGNAPQPVSYDKLPVGEVAVRRGDDVHATDGDIGRVQGLIIDPEDHGVTHILLQEGHLWGRKQVAIPITDVDRVDDGIRLKIAKEDVRHLPPVHTG